MTSLEELRRAIKYWRNPTIKSARTVQKYNDAIWDAAQTLLQLLETHTPEKIEALLKGEAMIIDKALGEGAINALNFYSRQSSEGKK